MNELERKRIEYELSTRNPALGPLKVYKRADMPAPSEKVSSIDGVNAMARRLYSAGGLTQQQRMVRDKQKSLAKALVYSYQGAFVQKTLFNDEPVIGEEQIPVRALINPNKVKPDYDEKIISIPWEHNFHVGDVFEWLGTDTHWLIYLQDTTELAYFRGQIRKCSYEVEWMDEDGETYKTYSYVRGPVETKIDYIQKHLISVERPNYSLHLYMPKNEHTVKYFRRYAKFYLGDGVEQTCWRIEATDAYSMDGVLEINAVEYYANEDKDDTENGIVNAKVIKTRLEQEELVGDNVVIQGEGFIKPKRTYTYTLLNGVFAGEWKVDKKYPIDYQVQQNRKGLYEITLTWTGSYCGQFDLEFHDDHGNIYTKTIIVESLF